MKSSDVQITEARRSRVADGPTLSVAVVSEKTPEELASCLDSLLPVCRRLDAELVVVRALESDEMRLLEQSHPLVRFVAAPPGTSTADMREMAMTAADGDIVCFQREQAVQPHWTPPRAFERS